MTDWKTEPTAADGLRAWLERRRRKGAGLETPAPPIANGDPECEQLVRKLEDGWDKTQDR